MTNIEQKNRRHYSVDLSKGSAELKSRKPNLFVQQARCFEEEEGWGESLEEKKKE